MNETKEEVPGPCIVKETDLEGLLTSGSGAPDRGRMQNSKIAKECG